MEIDGAYDWLIQREGGINAWDYSLQPRFLQALLHVHFVDLLHTLYYCREGYFCEVLIFTIFVVHS